VSLTFLRRLSNRDCAAAVGNFELSTGDRHGAYHIRLDDGEQSYPSSRAQR